MKSKLFQTCITNIQGQWGGPPPIDIPIRLVVGFLLIVTIPEVTFTPLNILWSNTNIIIK